MRFAVKKISIIMCISQKESKYYTRVCYLAREPWLAWCSRRLNLREPFVARADFYLCYGNYFS